MGGSSLAPEVLASSFANASLAVLDSTDPGAVLAVARAADFDRTLFVVCSKSGSTVETLAFYHYLAARADAARFVAITDPGSPLEALARDRGFRAVFPHPPDVGGRYAGPHGGRNAARRAAGRERFAICSSGRSPSTRTPRGRAAPGSLEGARGTGQAGAPPPAPVARLADWIEQLVAESTGKDGRGVVPVVDDPITAPRPTARSSATWRRIARPRRRVPRLGVHHLELCTRLVVNAFDQPNVEEAKALARAELARGEGGPVGAHRAAPLATLTPEALRQAARPGDYLAISRTCRPTLGSRPGSSRARELGPRPGLHHHARFGPRYLHSTGQLHKGGPNTGLFLVVTADDAEDADIPEMGTTFGA